MEQQGLNRRFKTLLPREAPSSEPQPSASPVEEGKTKRASTACKECKRRRTRCSTGNPCTECATHNRQCVYDETADKRRKAYTKFTQDQLQYYRGFLDHLLDSIRYSEQDQLDEIINVIRRGGSMDEIGTAVSQVLREINRLEEDPGDDDEEGSEALSGPVEDTP